jgi:uncharacterized protein HemX
MTRRATVVICLAALALLLGGCAGIRQQAEAYQQRLQEIEDRLEQVEAVTARNASVISDLNRRIEQLEQTQGGLAAPTP